MHSHFEQQITLAFSGICSTERKRAEKIFLHAKFSSETYLGSCKNYRNYYAVSFCWIILRCLIILTKLCQANEAIPHKTNKGLNEN